MIMRLGFSSAVILIASGADIHRALGEQGSRADQFLVTPIEIVISFRNVNYLFRLVIELWEDFEDRVCR